MQSLLGRQVLTELPTDGKGECSVEDTMESSMECSTEQTVEHSSSPQPAKAGGVDEEIQPFEVVSAESNNTKKNDSVQSREEDDSDGDIDEKQKLVAILFVTVYSVHCHDVSSPLDVNFPFIGKRRVLFFMCSPIVSAFFLVFFSVF